MLGIVARQELGFALSLEISYNHLCSLVGKSKSQIKTRLFGILRGSAALSERQRGGRSSVGRASGCGLECRGFNPRRSPQDRPIKNDRLRAIVFDLSAC